MNSDDNKQDNDVYNTFVITRTCTFFVCLTNLFFWIIMSCVRPFSGLHRKTRLGRH